MQKTTISVGESVTAKFTNLVCKHLSFTQHPALADASSTQLCIHGQAGQSARGSALGRGDTSPLLKRDPSAITCMLLLSITSFYMRISVTVQDTTNRLNGLSHEDSLRHQGARQCLVSEYINMLRRKATTIMRKVPILTFNFVLKLTRSNNNHQSRMVNHTK